MSHDETQRAVEEAAEWLVRRDGGKMTSAEAAEFKRWLTAEARNRTAFEEVEAIWSDAKLVPRDVVEPVAPAYRAPPKTFRSLRGIPGVAAAAFCVAAVLGLDVPTRLLADAYTETGEIRSVALPDGSTARLNTGSAIAIEYSNAQRRVKLLRGEAAFVVVADKRRPFLVDTAGGETKALGTAFSVRRADGGATVTVLESRVGVAYPVSSRSQVELSPGEAIHYSDDNLGGIQTVDADAETAWRRGKLIFVDRPLGSVIAELNRYHAGRIQIADSGISKQLVNGVFDTADPIRALDVLERALGIRSTRLTSYLILLHR